MNGKTQYRAMTTYKHRLIDSEDTTTVYEGDTLYINDDGKLVYYRTMKPHYLLMDTKYLEEIGKPSFIGSFWQLKLDVEAMGKVDSPIYKVTSVRDIFGDSRVGMNYYMSESDEPAYIYGLSDFDPTHPDCRFEPVSGDDFLTKYYTPKTTYNCMPLGESIVLTDEDVVLVKGQSASFVNSFGKETPLHLTNVLEEMFQPYTGLLSPRQLVNVDNADFALSKIQHQLEGLQREYNKVPFKLHTQEMQSRSEKVDELQALVKDVLLKLTDIANLGGETDGNSKV